MKSFLVILIGLGLSSSAFAQNAVIESGTKRIASLNKQIAELKANATTYRSDCSAIVSGKKSVKRSCYAMFGYSGSSVTVPDPRRTGDDVRFCRQMAGECEGFANTLGQEVAQIKDSMAKSRQSPLVGMSAKQMRKAGVKPASTKRPQRSEITRKNHNRR